MMTPKSGIKILDVHPALNERVAKPGSHATAPSKGKKSGSKAATGALEPVTPKLKASEMRYRRLFETAKDGILILHGETGRVVDCNPFIEHMLGYSRDEILGKRLWQLGPFRDIVASQAAFRELQDKEYIRYDDLPLQTKSGEWLQVEFVSNVYLVESTRVIQCNIRDITARKRMEAGEKDAKEQLAGMVTALQQRDSEMTLISRMNDLLQTCETREEAFRIIALTTAELFSGQEGCLAVFQPTGQYLETVTRWGNEHLVTDTFALGDCWALRRGSFHEVTDPATGLLCRHFKEPPRHGYLCLPLTVQGETLGVLYFSSADGVGHGLEREQHQLAASVGEAIKLSLSNLRLRSKLHEQATRDVLTGLFNRRYLEDTLARELHRALRSGACLSVAMLDLDHFKQFNDSFGHEAGDLILREWGRVLHANLRRSDIACRYGGEEFVLILLDSSIEDAAHRLEQIRLVAEKLEIRHEETLLAPTTVSIGIAAAPQHGSTAAELLRAADSAMYAAKEAGRNRLVMYQPVMET